METYLVLLSWNLLDMEPTFGQIVLVIIIIMISNFINILKQLRAEDYQSTQHLQVTYMRSVVSYLPFVLGLSKKMMHKVNPYGEYVTV